MIVTTVVPLPLPAPRWASYELELRTRCLFRYSSARFAIPQVPKVPGLKLNGFAKEDAL